jgi:hypothetical protein
VTVVEVVQIVLTLVVCFGLVWAARRIEPHWSSKDGTRFIARAQVLGLGDVPEGGWKEVRGVVEDGHVILDARGMWAARLRGTYRIVSKSPEPPARKAVYLLAGEQRVVLRLPHRSRTVEVLDRLVP